ncbi:MAG: hypothetical protein IPK60_11345 [Sandaracinaceae bacterium]|nr:hypothetical protein [Sandaracinaceae bacterium]
MQRFFVVALSLCLSACFIEASGGLYAPIGQPGGKPGYQWGLAAGLYIDPGPVRVALGVASEFATTSGSAGRAALTPGPFYARLDVDTPLGITEEIPVRITGVVIGDGHVSLSSPGNTELTEVPGSHAWSFFLGSTVAYHTGEVGFHFSIGPSVLYGLTDVAGLGDYVDVGGQARFTLSYSGERFLEVLGSSEGDYSTDSSYGTNSSGSSSSSSSSSGSSSSSSYNDDYAARQQQRQQQQQEDAARRQDQERERQNSERIRRELHY